MTDITPNLTPIQKFMANINELLNGYIFAVDITSAVVIDQADNAKFCAEEYNRLVVENNLLKLRLNNIERIAKKVKTQEFYIKYHKTAKIYHHLNQLQKLQHPDYTCCNVCDRSVKTSHLGGHSNTHICLAIRVSKELAKNANKKSIKYNQIISILAKHSKTECIIMFHNLQIIKNTYRRKIKYYDYIFSPDKIIILKKFIENHLKKIN